MQPLQLFWWNGGVGAGNFGDQLSPLICEALAHRSVVHSPVGQADLVAVGSILEPRFWPRDANLRFGGAIWGSGRMFGIKPLHFPRAHVAAVRGGLTHHSLQPPPPADCVLGDPGLLAPILEPLSSPRRKRYPLGVMPHWTERETPAIKALSKLSSEILIIDPCAPVKVVLEQITACDRIFASAMHGLIVADAFGIPNERLLLNLDWENRRDFKFRDYDSFWRNRQRFPVKLSQEETLDSLLARPWIWPPPVCQIQQALLSAFPFN